MTRTEFKELLIKCENVDDAYIFIFDKQKTMNFSEEDCYDWLDWYMVAKEMEN